MAKSKERNCHLALRKVMACSIIRSLVVTSYGISSAHGLGWPRLPDAVSCLERNCLIDVEDGQLVLSTLEASLEGSNNDDASKLVRFEYPPTVMPNREEEWKNYASAFRRWWDQTRRWPVVRQQNLGTKCRCSLLVALTETNECTRKMQIIFVLVTIHRYLIAMHAIPACHTLVLVIPTTKKKNKTKEEI